MDAYVQRTMSFEALSAAGKNQAANHVLNPQNAVYNSMQTNIDSWAALNQNLANKELAAVTEQSSASTRQASASTEETSASTEEIAASAQQLASTPGELQRLVSEFTLVSNA